MNLLKRIITAVVLLPLVIWALFSGSVGTLILLLIVAMLTCFEYGRMVYAAPTSFYLVYTALGGVVFLGQSAALCLVGLLFLIYFLATGGQNRSNLEKLGALFLGYPYICLALGMGYQLRINSELGLSLLLLALISTWFNDTFAYLAGRSFGKHKMWESVSPKKSWEGFLGGAVGSIVAAILGGFLFSNLATVDLFAIAMPAIAIAPLGDFVESAIKRAYGVKDSGQLMPGHGGFLDRIDGLLFMLPWAYSYAFFIRPLWY